MELSDKFLLNKDNSDLIPKNDTLPNLIQEWIKVTVIDSFRNKNAIEDYDSKFTEVLNDNNLLSGNSKQFYYLSSESFPFSSCTQQLGFQQLNYALVGLAF